MYTFGLKSAIGVFTPITSELTVNILPLDLRADIIDVLAAEVQDISAEAQVIPRLLQSSPDPINVDSVHTETILGVDI